MDAVQVWPQLLSVAGDLVAKAQDWPGADDLAERLKKTIPQQFLDEDEQVQPDPALQQAQMELQAMAQQIQLLETDKEIEYKKLEVAAYNAETQRIKALSDNEVDATKVNQDAIKAILDHSVKIKQSEQKETAAKEKSETKKPEAKS